MGGTLRGKVVVNTRGRTVFYHNLIKKIMLVTLLFAIVLGGCTRQSIQDTATVQHPIPVTSVSTSTPTLSQTPVTTTTSSITPVAVTTPLVIRPAVRSIDIVSHQYTRDGAWFSTNLSTLPEIQQDEMASFVIDDTVVKNRRDGHIPTTLSAGYVFTEWDISSFDFDEYDDTISALFIRSNLMSFVDYSNNRVLTPWNRKSINIPLDIRGIIELCNKKNILVFLQANYSDYIPGEAGTGIESLQPTDTTANLISFLYALRTQNIHVDGITFGDEIDDSAGYGEFKPTLLNTDLIGRFISFAARLKTEFPELKIYGFDSYISATRGQVSKYWDFFQRIKQAEIDEGKNLLDGFVFRESYVYMDEKGELLPSQLVLADTESLYRDTPVYRYDVTGISHPVPDRDYLHTVIYKTAEIFGRMLDIGLTEYLPAGPVQISEIDTSRYNDMDFIIHYSDMVGIYAELGLDYLSKIMFGNTVNQHKAYFDRDGNKGVNYPVHEQLARYFVGEILNVGRSVDYDQLKVKVYAVKKDERYFILILNKDVENEQVIRVTVTGQLDLVVKIPRRSYTSLVITENDIVISGIGN
jgi:hypothetical protein